MTGFEVGLFSVLAILILIYSGMYVPVALGLVSFVSVWLLRGTLEAPVYLLTLAASNSLEDYIFGVIPLFVLMGLLGSQCELGKDIYEVANHLLRRLRGGLGVATVAANAAFAAITGVSIASAAVFTRVSVPEMMRFAYKLNENSLHLASKGTISSENVAPFQKKCGKHLRTHDFLGFDVEQ